MTIQNQLVILGRGDKPVVAALTKGAVAAGLRPILHRPHLTNGRVDIIDGAVGLVVEGLRGAAGEFARAYRSAGIPVYIMEMPRLRAVLGEERNTYGESFGLYRNHLADLPLVMANRVVVEGRMLNRTDEYLLLIGQKPNDTAHGMTEAQLLTWVAQTARLASEQYGMRVMFRPHPKASVVPAFIPHIHAITSGTTLREDMARAAAVITYNSTAGVEAIDAGVPVLYTALAELVCYAEYARKLGAPIEPLPDSWRRAFLMRCGATQWTLEQIEHGIPFGCFFLGDRYPEPELVEPAPMDPDAPVVVETPTNPVVPPRGTRAHNRAMSREVVPDGR